MRARAGAEGLTGVADNGIKVTEATIAKALEGSGMQTLQENISLPMVQRYVKMLEEGSIAPPIKVVDNIIVDGNHRYVAGRVFGVEPATTPGTLSVFQASLAKPIQNIKVSKVDFGGK